MARVICFPDGSTEVLLSDWQDLETRSRELEKILQEHLGDDFMEVHQECYGNDTTTPDDYERACDGYRSCLQDTLDELRHILNLLEEPRMNRSKLTSAISRVIKSINNEL